jgi:hypothetical protein
VEIARIGRISPSRDRTLIPDDNWQAASQPDSEKKRWRGVQRNFSSSNTIVIFSAGAVRRRNFAQ